MERAFQLTKTNLNRRVAAYYEVEALKARFDVGFEQLDILCKHSGVWPMPNSSYYRTLVDYMLAIRDVHIAKGSLLEYDGVSLAEGSWSSQAYRDALQRSRHFAPNLIDYGIHRSRPISRGPVVQQTHEPIATPVIEDVPTPSPSDLPDPVQSDVDQLPTPVGSLTPSADSSATTTPDVQQ